MIKLIAVDLDGTLMPSSQIIGEETILAVRRAVGLGILIVLASGRCYQSAHQVQKTLGVEGHPMILHNGALLQSEKTGLKTIAAIPMPVLERFYAASLSNGWKISVVFGNCHKVYANNKDEFNWFVMREYNLTEPEFAGDFSPYASCGKVWAPNKILATGENLPHTRALVRQMQAEFGEELSILMAGERYIDIAPLGISKGVALKELMAELSLSSGDVMAIGDSDNDLSMLKLAGTPVAMANALESVKRQARYITRSNEEDGVGKAIEKYALGEKPLC